MTETTVADIIAQIEAEDKTVQRVDLRSVRGDSFKPDDTLQHILKDDFELVINDRTLPVTAPVFTGFTRLLCSVSSILPRSPRTTVCRKRLREFAG
jgi:hypothetical protein